MIAGLVAKGQGGKSYFYNEKGQFYLDTTLTISKIQYQFWRNTENNLAAAFSRIEYPPIYLENGIKSKSPIIVSFVCDTSDITEIKVLNDSSVFATAIANGIKQQGKTIVARLRGVNHSSSPSETRYVGKYYIAFSFGLVDFYEQLKTEQAIPIIRQSIPLISVGQPCPIINENDVKK